MRELYEMLEIQKDECIMQKNIFQTDFDEFSEEDSDVKSTQETEQVSSKNKKR